MAKILILTPQLPYPPEQGTSLRNFHILRGLVDRHEITLLSFLEENQTINTPQIKPLKALCEVHTVHAPARSMANRLKKLLLSTEPDLAWRLYSSKYEEALLKLLTDHHFDVVQIEGIELARYLPIIRIANKNTRIVFDDHNAEAELQQRNFLTDRKQPGRWPAAVYSWIQVRRLRRFECWIVGEADGVTAVSEADAAELGRLVGGAWRKKIRVVPNCIDVQEYQATSKANNIDDSYKYDLIFLGKMDYRPNIDAVLWFAEAVWPEIRRQIPSCTWAIVGQKPHKRLDKLSQNAGITVTGRVADIRPYLAGAALFIAPFRIGSGTRLKLIEAMAVGKAIIATPIGAEGFPVESGKEIIIAENALEMRTAVLRLLDDPAERKRLGQAARQFSRDYDFRKVITKFDELYADLMAS